ncbi:carboxyvinyl-carboxyphosphonate phosphorylmutase [Secundilactobacillus pentosiphilus]|uniref:Carboxyvinyl-carboxyphosphonate phosphorylmutase n=1 Tax=Secundilactobacillus pentosiphilus TaxID=1714682 RepID=A0A1Z5ILU9_9LACO|nr:isocitrate lyase/phosphoenolpyruvate mutase family protein [Secundilactobacillus pentosiphilus]GAX02552.1 carboxyvinyl-carboxyphosphonate phosphorylmutase [Secundilactobacillus pentosiphilus]
MTLKETFAQASMTTVVGTMDAQSTNTVEQSGYPAAYLNSYDVVRAELGAANEGLMSPSELSAELRHVKERGQFPVVVDAQSGFGNQLTTYFVAQDLERSGAAGVVLNDQIFPAHTAQDEVTMIEFSDFVAKLKAAKASFEDPETMLFAELDGVQLYQVDGLRKRLEYLQQNQLADCVLVGHVSQDQFAAVADLAHSASFGLVVNTVRDQFTADQDLASQGFKAVFYTGVLSAARQAAEKQAVQQFLTKAEV